MTTSDRSLAGLIGDRYEITGLIASGGMGSVYRARDQVLDRTVALKVLRAADDPSFVARFRAEATNAARLSHTNIVQVYDFGYADHQPFMAMEFIDGQNLRDIITNEGRLSTEHAARIAQQVAAALEHARRAGIVHRDIKPENILITTEGVVKVADFGLSRAFADARATQAGMMMGTAHYLSPEQVQGTDVDHRSDIYSLGIVLFEMLTGHPPFTGDSAAAIAYQRVGEDVPSILVNDPNGSRNLDAIIAAATERAPDERYQSAAQMAAALKSAAPRNDTGELSTLVHETQAIPILSEETIAFARPSERVEKRARKRRKGLILTLALVLLASAAFATASRFAKDPVPTVEGRSQESAEQILRDAGYDVRAVLRNDEKIGPGKVIAQKPGPGVLVRPGATIELIVSLGPELFKVPSVVGTPFADADGKLSGLGFVVKRIDAFSPTVKKLSVISQSPDSGIRLERGQTVTLTVSKGAELRSVPSVIGEEQAAAVAALESADFVVKVTTKTDDAVKGTVIEQTPSSGRAAKGSTVAIVVSKGPPPVTVPDLYCMTKRQATDVAEDAGFTLNFSGSGKRVVDQDPAAKSKAPKGSQLTAFMGPGSRC